MTQRIVIVGTGVMGETMLAALLRGGWSRADIVVCERRESRLQEVVEQYRVSGTTDVAEAVSGADVVALVVKPQDLLTTVAEAAPVLAAQALVISMASGLTTQTLESAVSAGGGSQTQPVVRVMPNTPALVGAGVSAISKGQFATDEHLSQTAKMLEGMGEVISVAEKDQDAVTALSGSGPAYVFAIVDAMAEGGVRLGLTREVATTLAIQTVLGSATLLRDTGEHPAILRERVTSPGGTTAAALHVLDDRAVRAAISEAMRAARDRSRELSTE